MGRDKNSKQPLDDFSPQQRSPMTNHYQSHIHFPSYNELTRNVLPTFDAKVVGLKPCSLNDILHILKELEYTLPIIPHLKGYCFIYRR